jgi:anti-anti-sigma factor
MKLLGDWNWYLPKWLDWLPRVDHEPAIEAAQAPAPEPPAASNPGVLTMNTIEEPGRVRLRLDGELDLVTAPWLAKRLSGLEESRPPVLVIDLRGLRFMDSSGLRELFSAQRRAHEQERRLVLVKGSAPIDRVLEMVRADAMVETVSDPGEIQPN